MHCGELNYVWWNVYHYTCSFLSCNNFLLFFPIWTSIATETTVFWSAMPRNTLQICWCYAISNFSRFPRNLGKFPSDYMLSQSRQFMDSNHRESFNLFIHNYVYKSPSVTAKYSRNTFVLLCVFCSFSGKKGKRWNVCDLQEAGVTFNLWSFWNW
jgi:hypothetical protein